MPEDKKTSQDKPAAAISRRGFLKGAGAAAAGLAVSGLPLPQAVQAATGQELCTVLDLGKCIGCEACVEGCRESWQSTVPDPVANIPQPFPARVPIEDWSKRKDVQDRLTPYNFLYVEHLEVPHQGKERELHIPRRCMHCASAPCTNLCPFGACQTEANGVTHIDGDVCFGGAKCKDVCPWKVPQRQSGVGIYLDVLPELAGNGVMFKCHRCLPLLAKGQQPRCIEVCPEKVQSIGPRAEQVAKAEALARQMAVKDGAPAEKWGDYVYGLKENGGTGTIYVAPMPFAAINAALMKDHQERAQQERAAAQKAGKKPEPGNLGRPHMGPVGASMESAEKITMALMIAPVAGLAAGLGRFLAKVGKLGKFAQGADAPASRREGGRS